MATGRRRRLLPWLRRWRTSLWCCACLLLLGLLALRDALPHYIMPDATENSRVCVPTTAEMDGCMSWRPLVLRHPICRCLRPLHALHDTCVEVEAHDLASYLTYTSTFHGNSTCSPAATLRGPNQLVLATSAIITSASQARLLENAARQAQDLYRGWTLRLYTSTSASDLNLVCPVVCNYPNIDLCGVDKAGVSDLAAAEPWGWKWAVMGDPLVSVWETRRLDEALQVRDAHATTQFANAPQCWHVMRDHVGQMRTIGSGMVGGKGSWGLEDAQKLRRQLLSIAATKGNEKEHVGTSDSKNKENHDVEVVLGDHLETANTMMHDSVACTSAGGATAVPFPSARPTGTWVGMPQTLPMGDEGSASRAATLVGLSATVEGRRDSRNPVENGVSNHLDPNQGFQFPDQVRNKDAIGNGFRDVFTKSKQVNHVTNKVYQSPLLRSLEIKGWKDGEYKKDRTWKSRDDASHNEMRRTSSKRKAKTKPEENVKNVFLYDKKSMFDLTVIKVPNNMLKTSGNHTGDSKQNSSANRNLKDTLPSTEHLEENTSSDNTKRSLLVHNDRNSSKAFNVSRTRKGSDLNANSVLDNAIKRTRPPGSVPKNEGTQTELESLTRSQSDIRIPKTEEDAQVLSPRGVSKKGDRLMRWPYLKDNNNHLAASQGLRETSKSKRSVDDLTKEFKSIHDLHRELGIPPCPEPCRPFLHPDWEYC